MSQIWTPAPRKIWTPSRKLQRGFFALPGGMGAARPSGGGGATYSPWTVSSLPSGVTASEANFKLSRSTGTTGVRGVYHPVTRSSGKYALRFLMQTGADVAGPAVGFLNGAIGAYLGASAQSVGFWINSGTGFEAAYRNGALLANLGDLNSFASATEVMLEVDFALGRVWFGVAGTWALSGNPGAGTNWSAAITTSTAYTLTCDVYYQGNVQLLKPSDFITPATAGFTPGWPD